MVRPEVAIARAAWRWPSVRARPSAASFAAIAASTAAPLDGRSGLLLRQAGGDGLDGLLGGEDRRCSPCPATSARLANQRDCLRMMQHPSDNTIEFLGGAAVQRRAGNADDVGPREGLSLGQRAPDADQSTNHLGALLLL